MSNVLSRFRSESALEFYTTARKIRGQLTRWAMNEKNIPKHYRLVLAFPLLSICDNLMNNITAANSVYPSWRGSILKQDAHRTAREMDRVFCVHFGQWPYTKKEMKQRGLFGIG